MLYYSVFIHFSIALRVDEIPIQDYLPCLSLNSLQAKTRVPIHTAANIVPIRSRREYTCMHQKH